jgi:SAM-dependent methyltransferase
MVHCRDCRLEFADPLTAPSEAWYSELYGQIPLYPAARWEFDVVAEVLSATDLGVEYRCGSGEFLPSVRHKDARPDGFDFSAAAVAASFSKGLQVHRLDLSGLHAGEPLPVSADHVVAFHVLEHLARPGALFEFAKGVIRPSGRLWVAVPSDRRASRVYGEADALDSPPHHLSRWSISALEAVGLAHGWTMERHLYEPLPSTLAVWEATRRLPFFPWASSRWRPLERLARRVLAAGVWLSGRHVRVNASGFSMLVCFRRLAES